MTHLPSFLINTRLSLPEDIWLEPEQIEQTKAMSEQASTEAQQWQRYLSTLALVGFEQWLSERLGEQTIQRLDKPTESVCYVEANGFTFCLIAVEHILDEILQIPQTVVEQPTLTAHFYVLLEVAEEQELVTMRGFCRYDELIRYREHYNVQAESDFYSFPIVFLDAEPNHLLFYCQFLQPTAIVLPTAISVALPTVAPSASQLLVTLTNTTTKLTQWLQDTFDQSWQAIDQLINPEAALLLSTRGIERGVRRGKLINLGVQLGQQSIVLLVNVTPEAEGKLGVLVQLYPTGATPYLMPEIKLYLRSSAGKTLQAVTSRSRDNYIQLKPFKGRPGTAFSVVIDLNNEAVAETFEL